MNIWLVMIFGGLLTYAIRLSFIYLLGKVDIPSWLQRSLRFVPPAVFSAIVFPDLLYHTGKFDFSLGNERFLAGVLAILVAWRTRNVVVTVLVGMIVLWLLQAIG